jgi:hypothetical protein
MEGKIHLLGVFFGLKFGENFYDQVSPPQR